MLGDVDHREVVGDEGLRQAGEGEGDEQRQRGGRRAGDGDPGLAVGVGADQRQGAEDQRNQAGEDEREMAEFGNHAQLPAFAASAEDGRNVPCWPLPRLRIADGLGGFRRHVVLVVLGQHFGGHEGAGLVQFALGDGALAFLEEVGKDALVALPGCPCRYR